MDGDELLRVHSIIHLIFHRNRNQHGRTKWWKWLSILKRTVWNLVTSLSPSDEGDFRASAESSRRFLADRILPRCYVAFSVVVADVQFSTLGTVLIATLAQLSKITGIDKELKSHPPVEASQRLVLSPHMRISKEQEDMGEALPRTAEAQEVARSSEQKQTSRSILENTARTTSRKSSVAKASDTANLRKKKKKRNTIDDLFDGLL
ncbi:uncharacterized protein BDV17DRAFT_154983 [Aspergillus undulatus]|uniref:uncharacterized protein n=1 Tax=Aspergillus undulatus TaxID=1810928 RepID=UPI003CCDB2FE